MKMKNLMLSCNSGKYNPTRMVLIILLFLQWAIVSVRSNVFTTCTGPKTVGELRTALWGANSTYDYRTRPKFARWVEAEEAGAQRLTKIPPDVVQLQMHLLSAKSIDQKRGEFEIMAWFRKRWNDYRLRYKTKENGGCFPDIIRQGFSQNDFKEIWTPHVAIENQVVKRENEHSFFVYPNGDVVSASSIVLTLSCKMNLNKYPNDIQNCYVRVGTWLEDAGDVTLEFYDDMEGLTRADQDGGEREWSVEIIPTHEEEIPNGATQDESRVNFHFRFERVQDAYFDFVIYPTFFFVTMGWSSFFINRGAAPARVTMSTICFLTNINFLGAQLNNLPKLSNDVWLLRFLTLSTIFTFYAVIEYVLCNILHRREARLKLAIIEAKEAIRNQRAAAIQDAKTEDSDDEAHITRLLSSESEIDITKDDLRGVGYDDAIGLMCLNKKGIMVIRDEHIDIFSRYGYPIAYLISVAYLFLQYYGISFSIERNADV